MKIDSRGELEVTIDAEKDFRNIAKRGFYLEAIAKIDAFIDTQLSVLVRQRYSEEESQELVIALEKAMLDQNIILSGIFKSKTLKFSSKKENVNLPDEKLRGSIKTFKGYRNKILHSHLGYYTLVNHKGKTNKEFQEKSRKEAKKAVDLGIFCFKELHKLVFSNLSRKKGIKSADLGL